MKKQWIRAHRKHFAGALLAGVIILGMTAHPALAVTWTLSSSSIGFANVNGTENIYINGQHYYTSSPPAPSTFQLAVYNHSSDTPTLYKNLSTNVGSDHKSFSWEGSIASWSVGGAGTHYLFFHNAVVSGNSNNTYFNSPNSSVSDTGWVTIGNNTHGWVGRIYQSANADHKVSLTLASIKAIANQISATMSSDGLHLDMHGTAIVPNTDQTSDSELLKNTVFYQGDTSGNPLVPGVSNLSNISLTASVVQSASAQSSYITKYTTSSGTEYSVSDGFSFGKKNIVIPLSTLQNLSLGTSYLFRYDLTEVSGSNGTPSVSNNELIYPSGGLPTVTFKAADGGTRKITFSSSAKAADGLDGRTKFVITDAQAPTLSVTPSTSAWTNGSVKLTATAADTGGSGVKSITLPNGSVVSGSSASQTVSANGTYTFKVTDNAGNLATVTKTVSNIDTTAPSLSVSGNPTQTVHTPVTLTVNGTDANSGIDQVETPDGVWHDGSTATYQTDANGMYVFHVKDNAGNTKASSVTVSHIGSLLYISSGGDSPGDDNPVSSVAVASTLTGVGQSLSLANCTFRVQDNQLNSSGWSLSIAASPLSSGGHSLPTGSILLGTPSLTGASGITPHSGYSAIDTGSSVTAASTPTGGSATVGLDSTDALEINVPASAFAGTYTTKLNWQLTSAP